MRTPLSLHGRRMRQPRRPGPARLPLPTQPTCHATPPPRPRATATVAKHQTPRAGPAEPPPVPVDTRGTQPRAPARYRLVDAPTRRHASRGHVPATGARHVGRIRRLRQLYGGRLGGPRGAWPPCPPFISPGHHLEPNPSRSQALKSHYRKENESSSSSTRGRGLHLFFLA